MRMTSGQGFPAHGRMQSRAALVVTIKWATLAGDAIEPFAAGWAWRPDRMLRPRRLLALDHKIPAEALLDKRNTATTDRHPAAVAQMDGRSPCPARDPHDMA